MSLSLAARIRVWIAAAVLASYTTTGDTTPADGETFDQGLSCGNGVRDFQLGLIRVQSQDREAVKK